MIRQAHTYLVGAMSGATLIAIAIAVFVVLVSTQVFTDWPIGALGSGNREVAVHAAEPVGGGGGAGAGGKALAGTAAGGGASTAATGGGGKQSGGHAGGAPGGAEAPVETGTTAPGGSGGNGGGGNGGGGSGGNGGAGAGSGGSGGQASEASSSPSSGGTGGTGAGSGGESGGGESGGGESAGGGSVPSPSTTITETVNGTVSGVDEKVLGGALEETGVTEVTEGVVNGLVGPESVVGHTLDETVHAVEGLLHPPGH